MEKIKWKEVFLHNYIKAVSSAREEGREDLVGAALDFLDDNKRSLSNTGPPYLTVLIEFAFRAYEYEAVAALVMRTDRYEKESFHFVARCIELLIERDVRVADSHPDIIVRFILRTGFMRFEYNRLRTVARLFSVLKRMWEADFARAMPLTIPLLILGGRPLCRLVMESEHLERIVEDACSKDAEPLALLFKRDAEGFHKCIGRDVGWLRLDTIKFLAHFMGRPFSSAYEDTGSTAARLLLAESAEYNKICTVFTSPLDEIKERFSYDDLRHRIIAPHLLSRYVHCREPWILSVLLQHPTSHIDICPERRGEVLPVEDDECFSYALRLIDEFRGIGWNLTKTIGLFTLEEQRILFFHAHPLTSLERTCVCVLCGSVHAVNPTLLQTLDPRIFFTYFSNADSLSRFLFSIDVPKYDDPPPDPSPDPWPHPKSRTALIWFRLSDLHEQWCVESGFSGESHRKAYKSYLLAEAEMRRTEGSLEEMYRELSRGRTMPDMKFACILFLADAAGREPEGRVKVFLAGRLAEMPASHPVRRFLTISSRVSITNLERILGLEPHHPLLGETLGLAEKYVTSLVRLLVRE